MSMVRCEECEAFIDSDFDADCFTEYDEVLCENCRDNQAERAWERHCANYEGPLPLIEQQRQAMKLK